MIQVVEKELLIKEKEKLYMELKQILARQPGPEVAEQLSMYQSTAKEKTKQMKVCILVVSHNMRTDKNEGGKKGRGRGLVEKRGKKTWKGMGWGGWRWRGNGWRAKGLRWRGTRMGGDRYIEIEREG